MLVEHEMHLCETGNLTRVSALRETMDGLMIHVERDLKAGTFTAARRAKLFEVINALLNLHKPEPARASLGQPATQEQGK